MDTLANRGRILFLTALAAFLPAASFCAVRPEAYARLPLRFEPNVGQADPQVRFLARSQGMTVLFTDTEAVMAIEGDSPGHGRTREIVRMKLAGAARGSHAAGLEKLPGVSNYFIGNDPAKWRTNIPNYARIRYRGIYPGVDLICYGKGRRLEYDLVVAPWADPKQIELAWEGVDGLELNKDGDLVLATRLGDVLQKRPRVYQETGGRKVPIAASYALGGGRRVTFELARYDRGQPLVIDPVTEVYGTYLGGSSTDVGSSIAVDAAGSAYITGYTYSTNFPIQGPYQGSNFESTYGNPTIFVTKLAPTGNALDYSTYLGGTGLPIPPTSTQAYGDQPSGIAVDGSGSVYITGQTFSSDFPTQLPLQAVNNSGGNGTVFVTKLAPAGNALAYSTYLGGTGGDNGSAIAVDATGAAYIVGSTISTNFPTQSPYQATNNVAGSNPTGFVAKLAPSGNALAYSTYLGGSGGEIATGIAVDRSNSAYVTGYTISTDFPTQSPYQAGNKTSGNITGFVTKLSAGGNALVYSTYLGGDADQGGGTYGDGIYSIAVDAAGEAYVAGWTNSSNFPTLSAFQSANGGNQDGFAAKLTAAGGALVFSTYLGGSNVDLCQGVAVDSSGAAYVAGYTHSSDFPVVAGYQTANGGAYDAFVVKLQLASSQNTITTSPAGLTVVVDGVSLTAPQTLSWAVGSSHSISVASPQASGGVRNTFSSWSDGGAQTHNVTAVTGGGTFTASFTTQYLLTTAAVGNGTIAANPTSTDGYYSSGATVQLTAAANSGYKFNGWGGDLSGTTNPQSLTMTTAHSVTAAFISSTTATALSFYPVTPCRAADTRGNGKSGAFGPPSMSGGSTRVFPISTSGCGVPSTAQAYSLNVTVVPAGQLTYLTMWPTGQPQPTVSTLNDFSTQAATPGNVLANAAIVPAGTSGSVSIFVSDTSDVIIDVNGYFAAPGTGGLAFYPVTPCRVADTRGNGKSGSFGPPTMAAGSTRNFPIPTSGCNVPATAQAYSLNMTVVPAGQLIYLTTWPTGQSQPVVSTLNDFSTQSSTLDLGRVVANAAIVPAGTSGAVSVFVSDASDVIIDINGYFAAPGGSGALSFYAAAPCRVADTRGNGFSGAFGAPSMAANGTRGFPIPVSACNIPNTAQAYSLNLTVLPPNQLIYLSTWPAGQSQPVVSTLNDFSTGTVVPGRVVANAAIVPAGTNGAVNVFTSDVTDLIIDINGYFAP